MSVNTAFTNPEPTTDDTWAAYYQKVAGRPPRPLFMKAISYYAAAPNADLIGRAAVDLGCGEGTETMSFFLIQLADAAFLIQLAAVVMPSRMVNLRLSTLVKGGTFWPVLEPHKLIVLLYCRGGAKYSATQK